MPPRLPRSAASASFCSEVSNFIAMIHFLSATVEASTEC
jgi:hypothetical protein